MKKMQVGGAKKPKAPVKNPGGTAAGNKALDKNIQKQKQEAYQKMLRGDRIGKKPTGTTWMKKGGTKK